MNGQERVNKTLHRGGKKNQIVLNQMILNRYVNKAELSFHQTLNELWVAAGAGLSLHVPMLN